MIHFYVEKSATQQDQRVLHASLVDDEQEQGVGSHSVSPPGTLRLRVLSNWSVRFSCREKAHWMPRLAWNESESDIRHCSLTRSNQAFRELGNSAEPPHRKFSAVEPS